MLELTQKGTLQVANARVRDFLKSALVVCFALLVSVGAVEQVVAQVDVPVERIDGIQTHPPIVAEGQGFELFVYGNGAWVLDRGELQIDEDAKTITISDSGGGCGTPIGMLDLPNQGSVSLPPLESGTYSVQVTLEIPWGCRSVSYQGEIDIVSLDRFTTATGGASQGDFIPQVIGKHESPAASEVVSGVGLVRGWACYDSLQPWPWVGNVAFSIDGGELIKAAHGTTRLDTTARCGDQAVRAGYGLVVNWNTLAVGEHNLKVYVDGVLFDDVDFSVAGFGVEFLRGVSAEYLLDDFPESGGQTFIQWSTPHQGFVIQDFVQQ